jgi:hypothetical protein
MDDSALGMFLQTCAGGKQVLGSGIHCGEGFFSLTGDGRY